MVQTTVLNIFPEFPNEFKIYLLSSTSINIFNILWNLWYERVKKNGTWKDHETIYAAQVCLLLRKIYQQSRK